MAFANLFFRMGFSKSTLSTSHTVVFKMTLFPGMKMLLRQKSRCFLTSNSQFTFLTDLPAYEQCGLHQIIPKIFWFLKISNNFSLQRYWITYVNFRYSKVRAVILFSFFCSFFLFFFWNAPLFHYTFVHIVILSIFLLRRGSHIWFLNLIICQQFLFSSSQICPFFIATAKFSWLSLSSSSDSVPITFT